MVSILTKKYNLGEKSGRQRLYTEDDVSKLKLMAHYRRYRRTIWRIFKYIKRNPGCKSRDIKKKLNLTKYSFDVAMVELTYMCYIWEEEDENSGKESYFIEGSFFDDFMELFESYKF